MSRIWASIKSLFRGLWSLIKKWPVRFQALIVALIALGSAFGLAWNGVQVAAVTATFTSVEPRVAEFPDGVLSTLLGLLGVDAPDQM